MPVDPSAQMILDLLAQAGGPTLEEMSPADARAAFAGIAVLSGEPTPVAKVEHLDADGVPVIVYWPEGDGPHPVLVWIHGGGWVIGSAQESDGTARYLCNRASCMVVSVDYRLAPEHPYPVPVEDSLTAVRWVLSSIGDLGGDPARVAVGGDSAGGNLSAVVAQQMGGALVGQVLVYPATDLTNSSPSIDENAEGYLLTKSSLEWFVAHYVSGGGDPATDPLLSPLRASSDVIAAVAPAIVLTAEFDPLRDDGEAYARAMSDAGVEVEHIRFDGQIHAFFSMLAAVPASVVASDAAAAHLRKCFHTA